MQTHEGIHSDVYMLDLLVPAGDDVNDRDTTHEVVSYVPSFPIEDYKSTPTVQPTTDAATYDKATTINADSPTTSSRPSRVVKSPQKWDYVNPTRNQKRKHPLAYSLYYRKRSNDYQCYLENFSSYTEPQSFKQVVKDDRQVEAMQLEIQALEAKKTQIVVELPKGKNTVNSKQIYKIKFQENGEVERFKARLVAKGYGQREVLYYHETYSTVPKMVIVRCVIAVALSRGWCI